MYLHINDRSDLDEVVSIGKNAETGKYDIRTTRRQDLEKRTGHRSDVVLMNCTRSGMEYCLFVDRAGFYGDTWLLDVLSNEQYDDVIRFAQKMRDNAVDFEPARKLVDGW